MEKYELEEKFGIGVPNFNLIPVGGSVLCKDPESGNSFKTSILNVFSFYKGPFSDNQSINDFDFYSIPILEEKKILPFGDDGGGYFFCIDYRNDVSGEKVVLWVKDNEEPYDIIPLADSFDEFINTLKSEDEMDMGVS